MITTGGIASTLPGDLAPDEIAILEADGIDYYSAIWLAGQRLATHAGISRRQSIVLSPTDGCDRRRMKLAIHVWGGGALPKVPNPPWRQAFRWLVSKVSPGTEYFPDRMATPKAQFSFGWDFAPRLFSTGIWDDIRLVVTPARTSRICGCRPGRLGRGGARSGVARAR